MKSSAVRIRLSSPSFSTTQPVLGAVLAFLGIFLDRRFRNPYLDPGASIVIGLLLAVVAIFLGRESGALLIGERTNRARIRRVKEIITADPSVEKVGDLLTMQLGPQPMLLTVNIQFQRDLDLQQLELTIDRIENRVCESEPMIQRILIEAESFKRTAESPSKAA
jgi:divalent metal cation (Fe/Co/Zn/Cd) transporter